ncbi:hypothetical protein OX284_001205 [Flavobacterium sp. SUN046]|nr:hypothetical protein [Flavobacterium sp. SUN046]MEC4048030.1 hypothetical protein [Flavobacterium sp. SUN046]
MKLLVEIPDNKVESLILLLKEIPKVKVKTLTDSKATLIKEIIKQLRK